MYFDGVAEPMEAGSCVVIPKGVTHSINNQSDVVMKLAYMFAPPVVQGSYDKKK